jgi:hypothetical protein
LAVTRIIGSPAFVDPGGSGIAMLLASLLGMKISFSMEKHTKKDFLVKRLVKIEQERITTEKLKADKMTKNMFFPKVSQLFLGEKQLEEIPHFIQKHLNYGVLVAQIILPDYQSLAPSDFASILNNSFFGPTEAKAAQIGLEMVKKNGLRQLTFVPTEVGSSPQSSQIIGEPPVQRFAELANLMLVLTNRLRTLIKTSKPVMMKIGIHTGTIIEAFTGENGFNFDFYGDAVNIATLLCSRASPNSILVSDETMFLLSTSGNYEFEEKGTIYYQDTQVIRPFALLPKFPNPNFARKNGGKNDFENMQENNNKDNQVDLNAFV